MNMNTMEQFTPVGSCDQQSSLFNGKMYIYGGMS